MSVTANRYFVLCAGLFGAAGVALSAVAAHAGGADLGPAATMLLVHASAMLAIGLLATVRLTRIAGGVLALGAALFAGDLVARHFTGHRLFPMAAPVGGVLMIGGWLLVAASAFAGKRSSTPVSGSSVRVVTPEPKTRRRVR